MLSDLARICRNISLIIHYKLIDVSNIVQAYIQDYYDSWKKSPRYIDNPRYIYQDYEDSYDIKDYSSPSGGESNYVIKRNEWGLPIE